MAVDIEKLNDSPHLLDILVQMEDIIDSLDIYVFANWMKGEVVEGPIVRRYWFDITLRYDIDEMPDPRGAMRLLKQGVRVDYNKATVEDDDGNDPGEPTHWEIKISMPKRLIRDMNAAELDFYDEDIDMENVQDAQDVGLTDEAGISTEENTASNEEPNPDDEEGFL